MPIPFILGGIALAAAGYGIKKGIDAKDDFDTASNVNSRAKRTYDDAFDALDKQRESTKACMENLGKLKFSIYENQLIPFVDVFERIKNIDFEDAKIQNELRNLKISQKDMLAIKKAALDIQSTIGAGVTSLGAGGLAGLAAYGAVGAFGAASTGTAIAGLGGVAATNATLAWLGGGSLAAGGFGMAGGMAVLGGIVAGPVLAVGGAMLASKAEEAKHDAYSNLSKAELLAEEMHTATVKTKDIEQRFTEVSVMLAKLQQIFSKLLNALTELVNNNQDFKTYDKNQRALLMVSFASAKTIKNLMEAQLLAEDGTLLNINQTLLASEEYIAQQNSISTIKG